MRRAVLILGLALVGVAVAAPLPQPVELPPAGMDILDRDDRLLYQVLDPERGAARPVALDAMAPALRAATIAVEDATFETNLGVDPFAMLRALGQDISAGRVVAGGSTLTQQLARLRYMSSEQRTEHSLARKLDEAWLAIRLTTQVGKAQVLETYLNSAPYGNLAVGAEAAAWTYFAKPARELSLAEAALLAGLPQSPTNYDPFTRLEAAQARQRVVLDLMLRRGSITQTQADAARAEPLHLNARPFPIHAAHFVDYVRSRVPPGTTAVHTTLDRDLQSFAERAAARQVASLAEHDVGDAAVVVLDPRSGDVLAMVGGVDYFDSAAQGAQVNMAVAPRQPGSAFKPITYAAALESGHFTEASVVDDVRTAFVTRRGETYVPENYDHQLHGTLPLRVALASSLNVPAVRVLSEVGIEPVLSLANEAGLHLDEPEQYDLSLTLGGAEVRLLDLTAAYGAFASGGTYHAPRVFTDAVSPTRRIMSAETAWLISDMLSDDAARGLGFGRESVLAVPNARVAVKTGTTSDFRDNWTIGYTPEIVVGVWVGNPDNHAMRDVSGVAGAAPLWREVLEHVLDRTGSAPQFERPSSLEQRALCAAKAADASAACAARRLEWLPRGLVLPDDGPSPGLLRVIFPDPGATFALDPRLPATAQQLPIEISTPAPGAAEIYVDGQSIGQVDGRGAIGWPPTPGRHSLWAVAGALRTEPVEVRVVLSRIQEP